MTLIAGAFAFGEPVDLPKTVAHSIELGISRNPEHRPRVFRRPGVMIAKLDIGAFGEPGHFEGLDGSLSLTCGEFLLRGPSHQAAWSRTSDLKSLHEAGTERLSSLSRCDGVFSFVHVPADGTSLVLATDHLGIRPLYYLITRHFCFFSSTLRVLQGLPGLPRALDLRGVAEVATLGYGLAERTTIEGVARLLPAEVLHLSRAGKVKSERYFNWEQDLEAYAEESAVPTGRIYDLFVEAIKKRLRSDSSTVAFLSGGLDSRTIVSVLRSESVQVHTFNFSVLGMQDGVFASRFSELAGTTHHVVPRRLPASLTKAAWSFRLRQAMDAPGFCEEINRPRLVWSGDGGSVCVGAVYITDLRARFLEDGDIGSVVDDFTPSMPTGIVASRGRRHLRRYLRDGVLDSLSRIQTQDPFRRFHLFLLFNDQRRHLDGHFEEIDRHGFEFQLPFFDSTFLKEVLRVPVRYLRNHRFYHDWLHQFPAWVTAAPWQTYPEHLRCPVSCDESLPHQWEKGEIAALRVIARSARRLRVRRVAEMVLSGGFPSSLLSRLRLLAVGSLHATGLREYDYLIDYAYTFYQHSRTATSIPSWPG